MGPFAVRGRLALGSHVELGAVVIDKGRIVEVLRDPSDGDLPPTRLTADIVAPGLIDLQINGSFGIDVGDNPDDLRRLAARLPETGVTGFLPTLVSSAASLYPAVISAFDIASEGPGARLLGLHIEGPFISPARPGAHRRELIEAADADLFETLLAASTVRVMTLAPERPGGLERIRRLHDRGIVASLGHTNASFDEFVEGIDAGATMATHLFNAMSSFSHRAPAAIGAALVDDRVTIGLIVDGVHAHPASIQLAYRAKGDTGIALVTDAMSAAAMPPGRYPLGGRTVIVDETAARLEDGTLAGSLLTLDAAVRNAVAWMGASPAAAIRMASTVPARLLGFDQSGQIGVGHDADLTLFDDHLVVQATIIGGETVYRKENR